MKKTLNWVVATYAATKTCMALEMQLQSLYMYLLRSVDRNILKQVTVVTPPVRIRDRYTECKPYFVYKKWYRLFRDVDIKLKQLPYTGLNTCASYDQWIQAFLAFPNFDYYIVVEDDYLIHPNAPSNLLDELVGIHDMSSETGAYVCMYAAPTHGLPFHAAISNGIIGHDAFAAIPDILETYYQTVDRTFRKDSQIAFSNLFMSHNIPVASMHAIFAALFWSSSRQIVENYSPHAISKYGLAPLQILGTPCTEIKRKTHL